KVQVEKEGGPAVIHVFDVVGVELKEGGVAVGAPDGAPVYLSPALAVVNLQFIYQNLTVSVFHGHGQQMKALGGQDMAAVAVTLLLEMFLGFQQDFFCLKGFLEK